MSKRRYDSHHFRCTFAYESVIVSVCCVGAWTGPAIRILAPFWNMDVTTDFLAATCPKLVANDSSDEIIADASSLKSGISLRKEVALRGGISIDRLGWRMEAPLTYRMADWENLGVNGKSHGL